MERLQRDKSEADQHITLLKKDLQVAQAKKRTIDASFEKLDKARERTRSALQHSRSLRGGLSTPGSEAGDAEGASQPESRQASGSVFLEALPEGQRNPGELLKSKSSVHSGPYHNEMGGRPSALRPSATTVRPGWSGRAD
jgi:hypothetical protein